MCLCRIITAGVMEVYHIADDFGGGMVHIYNQLPPVWQDISKGRVYKKANCSDDLSIIAEQVFLLTADLDNKLKENAMIKPGDKLRIPVKAPAVTTPPAESTTGGIVANRPGAVPQKSADAPVRWPIDAREVSYMTGKLNGVVLLGERTETVRSLTQGTVVTVGPFRGFGRVVIVEKNGGYLYVYGGCESLTVKEGDRVSPGMELGKLGIDTQSGKPQLFFLVYQNNVSIDPAKAPRL